jgi:hypothetical protein
VPRVILAVLLEKCLCVGGGRQCAELEDWNSPVRLPMLSRQRWLQRSGSKLTCITSTCALLCVFLLSRARHRITVQTVCESVWTGCLATKLDFNHARRSHKWFGAHARSRFS